MISISGNKKIVVGMPNYSAKNAPQKGKVLILTANGTLLSHSHSLDGDEVGAKFGQGISMVDFNCDEIDDMVIGSPSAGAANLSYHGTVKIYLSKSSSSSFQESPDIIIHGLDQYENFGYLVKSMDVNQDGCKDLIVTSPLASSISAEQTGFVKVFLSKRAIPDVPYNLSSADADLVINGTQDYEWFGTDVVFHSWKGRVFAFVGAPCHRICHFKNCSFSPLDKQEMGMVYIYEISRNGHRAELVHIIEGEGGRFGWRLTIGNFYFDLGIMLAVSAPIKDVKGHLINLIPTTFEQAGMVYILDLMNILTYHKFSISIESVIIASVQGDRSLGHFGFSMNFIMSANQSKSTQDLVVGSPYRTKDFTHEFSGAEQGAIYVFRSSESFPKGSFTNKCGIAPIKPCPSKYAGQYFEGKEDYASLGHDFAIYRSRNRTYLAISAPRSNINHFHGGNIITEQLI